MLLRLIREGHAVIRGEREVETAARRKAIEQTSGALTGAYDEDYLISLRDDWPA